MIICLIKRSFFLFTFPKSDVVRRPQALIFFVDSFHNIWVTAKPYFWQIIQIKAGSSKS